MTGLDLRLRLLCLLAENPVWTQRQVADVLGLSLGKTNFCLRASSDKGLINWGNISQNPKKYQLMYLPTPKGIIKKLCLTAHFLFRKKREFDGLLSEIASLRKALGKSNFDFGAAPAASLGITILICESIPLGQTA